jgi:arabinan endo-1,5-alpha-L-arabinosidase
MTPTPTAASYSNPIYNIDFPDPGILRTTHGLYAYGSQGLTAGGMHNIQVAFSRNGVTWEIRGDALPTKASWAADQDYWAPHVVQKGETYFLFYNAKTGHAGQGIGVATAQSPEGPFVDSGTPLVSGESYINIDAFVFQDVDDRWWMCWGSCFEPIKLRELDESLLQFAMNSVVIEILTPEKEHAFARLHEAPWIHPRFDPRLQKIFYYLFTSGADAFGLDSYGIMVARSEQVTGPYETFAQAKGLADSVILRSNERFLNPGAHAMFTDDMGQEWLLYHAYEREGLQIDYATLRNTARVLMLDRLDYDESGWPYTRTGTPSIESETGPVFLQDAEK